MQFDQWAILAIIITTLGLFIFTKLRYDLVAMIALMASVLVGVVPAEEAFLGFGHPATITVGLVLILSHGLTRSGAVEGITGLINSVSHHPTLHIAALTLIAACFSMFMNNVGALALLMPVAIDSARNVKRPIATILMPLSFGSILGGLVTMIGTPPNIIIANYRATVSGESFSMFDFSPIGGTVALGGICFIILIGWRLVKPRKSPAEGGDLFNIESYLSEVKLNKDCELIGKTPKEFESENPDFNIIIANLIRKKRSIAVPPPNQPLQKGDILLLEGSHAHLDQCITKYKLTIMNAEGKLADTLRTNTTDTVEAVIAPLSPLEKQSAKNIRFKRNHNINLLAVSRAGKRYKGRLQDFTFHIGDVLLLHGDKDSLPEILHDLGCMPLAKRLVGFGFRKLALPTLGIFIAAILATTLGFYPMTISFTLAAGLLILLNVIPLKELYQHVNWPVIILLGAMLPVGSALESTGTTNYLVDRMLSIFTTFSPILWLVIIMVVTMTLSDILNNAATAILMAPIAKTLADSLSLNVDTYLMAVAIGASCAFLTPIGHQNNALIMGPGGYKFGDYWRLGLPLEIVIVAIATPMLLIVFPL